MTTPIPSAAEYRGTPANPRQLRHLRAVRQAHYNAAQEIVGGPGENRTLKASEQRIFDGHLAEVEAFDKIIEEAVALERTYDELRSRIDAPTMHIGQPAKRAEAATWLPSMAEYRAVNEGTDSAGGYFVPEQNSSMFFDRLAARSVVLSAGPRIIDATGEVVNIPKIGASVSVSMTAENSQITPNDPTFEQVQLTPQKLTAMTLASNESLDDSNPSLREVLAYDHERSMALKLDEQFLEGDGSSPNLRGVRNFTGVTDTPLGANGATPTLDDIADAIERLETDNANAAAIFMHPRSWAVFRTIKDVDERYQLAPDPTAESRRQLFGVPVYVSSQIAIDETVGTSTDCSWIAVVDMSQIVVARRKDIGIEYSRSFRFDYDQTAIRTVSRWSIAPINEEGVELITGVRGA